MLLEILKRTPVWVYVLFTVLLAYGLMQVRTRRIGRRRVVVLPAVMMALSLIGVASSFGLGLLPLALWLAGVALAHVAGQKLRPRRHATHDAGTDSFVVPGSWLPLALMMAIFFARYAITVAIAIVPALAASDLLAGGASLLYGTMSGIFLARALHILAARARHAPQPAGAAS
jgi:hypothetical protein